MHPSARGPSIVVERLCFLTPSEGWNASVITTSLYCNDDGSELEKSLRQRVDVTVLPISKPRTLKRAHRAKEVIDKAVRVADIVHVLSVHASGLRIPRRSRSRLINEAKTLPSY